MKLAFVVQRYGADIAGGSEAHCRALAHRLSAEHDVTVLTSCATDYVSWTNARPPGLVSDGPVHVEYFPVRRPRSLHAFAALTDEVLDGRTPDARQEAWFAANGPDCPALLDHLRTHGPDYDLVLFWTFRYAPSFFGLPLVADRAILVPTAEEDPILGLPILRGFFRRAAGYLFMTPEEQAIVGLKAGRALEPCAVIGAGVDPHGTRQPADVLLSRGVGEPFFLYLGRVDVNKGCGTLLDYYARFADATPGCPPLVLAGPTKMTIPSHPAIRPLGYVSDQERAALLERALALIVPSPYESLSIVLLEAWNAGTPAIVNGGCRVLQGQVRRANGGLYYRSSSECTEALQFMLQHPVERASFGRQGLAFVEREYRWPTVLSRVRTLLTEVAARRRPADAPSR